MKVNKIIDLNIICKIKKIICKKNIICKIE